MDYNVAYKKLESLDVLGSCMGLDNMQRLLHACSNPQNKLKVVHVAGTNGKGSVVSYLESIAVVSGVQCGAYTSPALTDFKENIRVGGVQIGEADCAKLLGLLFDACQQMVACGYTHPTRFEVETALAFLYFVDKGCEIVFLETGLGGALDATHVVAKPICVVLSRIGFDHMQELGSNLKEITLAECGIFKRGVPVFTLIQEPDVIGVIECVCKKLSCSLAVAELYQGSLVSRANYARHNAGLAQAVAKHLGYAHRHIVEGLGYAHWFGRFSEVRFKEKNLTFILDGAHNISAVEALVESLNHNYPNQKYIFIVGIFKDKQVASMVQCIGSVAKKMVALGNKNNKRIMEAESLKNHALQYIQNVHAVLTPLEAVEIALEGASVQDVVVVCGSLSILADVYKEIINHGKD